MTKSARKTARKLAQRPCSFAAQHRADLFRYLDQAARLRNPQFSKTLLRSYCAMHRRAAAADGFRLPA
jgi:hypothetical protein